MTAHWVLLRGLTRDRRHWGDFPDIFAQANPGQGVYAVDLAGNGERHRERSPASVAGMVDDLREALRRQGIAGPHRLLALSLGGMAALEWAARHPEEVERVVLVDSSFGRLSPFYRRLRPAQYLRLLLFLACPSAGCRERLVMAMTSNRPDARRVAAWAGWRRSDPVAPANALRQMVAAARYRGPAATPALRDIPILLLASRGDRLVDVACSRAMANRFGWPLFEHPEAGHDIPLDDPHWVAERVRDWLAGGPPGG
jgi:pimeloyl-ACP methyl ester carboxylesterase